MISSQILAVIFASPRNFNYVYNEQVAVTLELNIKIKIGLKFLFCRIYK